MIIEGMSKVDLNLVDRGDIVRVKIVEQKFLTNLISKSSELGCNLIMLQHGEFFFKEYLSERRNEIIRSLLED